MTGNPMQFQSGKSIASRLGGHVLALDVSRALDDLMMDWPQGDTAAQIGATMAGPLEVQKGERFAISRRIAVMPVRGVLTPDSVALERYLGWATYQGVEASCAELAANEDVAACVIDMNSPGGLILGLEGAAQAIADLAAQKPVHVLVNPMAASAAYYLASQASDITMTAGSSLGSIGTTRMSVWPVKPDAWGDQWGVHLSSYARAKNPDPTSEDGQAEIQRSLDEAEAAFLDAVARGRNLDRAGLPARLSVTENETDGGAMYAPADAINRGLADRQETRAGFYDRVFASVAPAQSGSSRAMARTARAQADIAAALSKT